MVRLRKQIVDRVVWATAGATTAKIIDPAMAASASVVIRLFFWSLVVIFFGFSFWGGLEFVEAAVNICGDHMAHGLLSLADTLK